MVHFNWTQLIEAVGHHYIHVATFIIAGILLMVLSIAARISLKATDAGYVPASRLSIKGFFEVFTEFIVLISDMVLGKEGRKYVPMFSALFLVIFINNLFGLLPGWTPATDNMNTTLALGVFMFFCYNFVGFKEQGAHYLQHFWGPIVWMGPFMVVVELISHSVRPFSLGLRLQGNMMGDHTLMGVFISLVPYVVPVIFLGLGLFVSFMQAFVFTMLGMIYISMAVAHDH